MRFTFLLLTILAAVAGMAQTYTLKSPSSRNSVQVEVADQVAIEIFHRKTSVLRITSASLQLEDGQTSSASRAVVRTKQTSRDSHFQPAFYAKRQTIRDHYNQLEVQLSPAFSLVVRAYDDGIAYRWRTHLPAPIKVRSETGNFSFPTGSSAYLSIVDCQQEMKRGGDCYHSSFERTYSVIPLTQFSKDQLAFLPALIAPPSGPKVLLTESDLIDYPGMWLRGSPSGDGVVPDFARFPLKEKITGDAFPQRVVTQRAGYLAQTQGTRDFPWRVMVIAQKDGDLIESDIVYRLAKETAPGDWSWLKPGKSQSEWLHNNHLYNIPFRAGYNTETYKFYIDFAKRFGLGYAFLDAGWSAVPDLFKLTPEMDLPEIARYATEKEVGLVLWTSALAMETQMEPALDRFAEWGVDGIMVDFMDRDDQNMVNFYELVLREAAKRKIFVDFHGTFKPTGLERRYPNAITREGVMASEYYKWSTDLTPEYEATVPFIRMVAGSLDYEPGHMKNAQKDQFRPIDSAPMTMGTRMHQVAMYVVYESPYSKMGGNVSDYLREPEITQFMSSIPGLWKETRVLDAKLADYVVILREARDGSFYVGALTDWSPRDLEIATNFLPEGNYRAEIYADGINADQYGIDYTRSVRDVTSADKLKIKMAAGGGWVAKFSPVKK
jgi:alpha-glucosidase